jgi:hypothetical protein
VIGTVAEPGIGTVAEPGIWQGVQPNNKFNDLKFNLYYNSTVYI